MKRLQATYGLLTYTQCQGLDPTLVAEHIASLGGKCVIGREPHEDGGTHLHAFCHFVPRLRTHREDWADIEGFPHPNFSKEVKGTPWEQYDYAVKQQDIVHCGLERPKEVGKAQQDRAASWIPPEGLKTEKEGMEWLSKAQPEAWIKNHGNCMAWIHTTFKKVATEYKHDESIVFDWSRVGLEVESLLKGWVENSLIGHVRGGEHIFF